MKPVAPRISKWIAALDCKAIAAVVVARAKDCLRDPIGCEIAGAGLPHLALVLRHVRSLGGNIDRSIVPDGNRTDANYAG